MTEFTSTVTVEWGGNNHEASNIPEYIQKVKDQYKEEYGITINDSDITDIKESEDNEPSDQEMMAAFGTKWHDGL